MARLRRKKGEEAATDIMELLNLTPMMDVFTVLVVFLLITAVFTSITVMDLSVPTSAGGAAAARPNFAIEVVVRKAGLEIANGRNVEASIPLKDGKYDLQLLSQLLQALKAKYPEKEDATVLMEPKIQYDYLVQVMDTVRSAGTSALFPKISIGDAP
ncbi:biopolymer transporter ExbD [Geomonas sp.]|uniref:ExbD/TolR family protein n=1 Tax=Geomonas sp. TaxID=2651584 RepID=UPI002B47BD2E|nr:biopolymer transporter ExbD [Geomonas sp.]HJV36735.1 biopolymer transporter ExbD [Geomonas sp.]